MEDKYILYPKIFEFYLKSNSQHYIFKNVIGLKENSAFFEFIYYQYFNDNFYFKILINDNNLNKEEMMKNPELI